jgi:hypothetical protein
LLKQVVLDVMTKTNGPKDQVMQDIVILKPVQFHAIEITAEVKSKYTMEKWLVLVAVLSAIQQVVENVVACSLAVIQLLVVGQPLI